MPDAILKRDETEMRIAFVAPHAGPLFSRTIEGKFGGAEVQQMLLARYLANDGHDVSVLVKRSAGIERPTTVDEIRLLPFSMEWAGGNKLRVADGLVSLGSAVRRARCEAYIIKVPRILLAPLGTMVRLNRGRLVFWLSIDRDIDLTDDNGLKQRLARTLYLLGLKFPHLAIAQSLYQQEGAARLGLKATFLPSLVKPGPSDWRGAKTRPPTVLWVGSHMRRGVKSPLLFVEMAKNLPHIRFKMIAVTDAEERERELREAARALPNLEYLGEVGYHEIESHYAEASLFVSTSGLEGVPNTFLQSWACGTPVASLNVDPDGVIRKMKLGVFADGNRDKLTRLVRDCIADPAGLESMGRNARNHVEATHGLAVNGPRYVETLRRLVETGRSGGAADKDLEL